MLNLKSITSPSLTTYSLPSSRALPASLAGTSPPRVDVVVVGDGLGADEAALEVGVDDAGRLRRAVALVDRPGPRLLRPGREIGLQAKQLVGFADQSIQARARGGRGSRGTPPARRRAAARAGSRSRPRSRSPRRCAAWRSPRRAWSWRCRSRPSPRRRCRRRAPACEVRSCSSRNAFSSSSERWTSRADLPSRSRTSARSIRSRVILASLSPCLAFFSTPVAPLLEALEVGEHQLGLDHFGIGDRVDLVGDVDDVAVLEAAQHVGDRVALADVGEELVAEAFALAGALHEAGDVDKAHPRRDDLLPTSRSPRACRAARPAPRPRRCSARWCRTGSSPPARWRCGSAR